MVLDAVGQTFHNGRIEVTETPWLNPVKRLSGGRLMMIPITIALKHRRRKWMECVQW